jgi:RHS repeat-associated protein
VKKITHQDANTIIYNYTNSNLTITNEAGKNTEFTYNAFGNPDEKLLMSVKDALGYTSSYNYSILGSLTNITQGSVSRTFHYNSKNFLDYETHPEKGTINYTRDNVGNMWTKQDSLGTTSYVYDELDRLRTINYGTGTITFTYDNENNRKTMNYPSGSVTYTHDPSNRLTNKEETILGILYTTGYVYNGNDYVTDIYYPSKNHVIYTYNDKNEVTLVTGSGWDVHDMAYYKDGTATGLPKSFRYSNNVVTDLTYNKRNLTTSIQAGSLSSVLDMAYAYKDPRGNMTSMTKNYLDPSNSPGSKLNELIQTVGGMPAKYTYQNNRLASISGAQSFSMDYNTDGDATYMNDGGLEYTLGYDRLHNLTSFKHKGAPLAEFSYDGDGRRKVKTSAAGKVVYHYDAGGRVLSETGINGNLISDYVYANGKLVAKRSPTAVYFYHTDPAGTPLAMTDSAGNLVWRGDYLPFGEENLITATEQNDYKFVGKELDKETGLYYFGARYMEATIGRFISSDPMEAVDSSKGKVNDKILLNPQGLNRYAYSLNNPYRYLDPDGRIWVTIETTRRTHLLNNLGRGILGWISKEIGEGMPIRRGRPPFSDPGELIGEKRDVIQEWQPDLKHPELDEAFPYGSRRIIEQTNQEADPRDYLRNDPDKPVYDYFPRVPDRTYQNYPNVKYDYSNVDPEDKKSYLKQDTSSTGLNYPVIRPAP